jgi:transposase InsO family protein
LPLLGGYSVILVVVDHFTKYAHIYPLKHPYTASSVGATFLNNVVKLHGLPKSIVSDRDKVFTSNFWTKLFELLNIKLQMSLAYHPQTDGQTERMNQCLEMYLWCVISSTPKQWVKWLPLAEVWYNSSYHSSSKCSPFKALYGSEPSVEAIPEPVLTEHNIG